MASRTPLLAKSHSQADLTTQRSDKVRKRLAAPAQAKRATSLSGETALLQAVETLHLVWMQMRQQPVRQQQVIAPWQIRITPQLQDQAL
jgi:hypothetical protein